MLSYKEAKEFLENILGIPKIWEKTLQNDKLGFLRLYMKYHATRVPFQNISMAAVEVSKRCRPTEAQIISQGLTGIGGCCLNLNYFSMLILKALGLDAYAIQGTHFTAPVPGTHCMTLVKLGPTELYLVEVGGQFPLLEPIPMHKLPFRILCSGGFPYEFREVSPGVVGRYQIGGGLFGGAYVGKSEALRTSWKLTPNKFSDFDHAMDETFTNPPNSVLLRNPMMCRYFYPEEFRRLFPFDGINGIKEKDPEHLQLTNNGHTLNGNSNGQKSSVEKDENEPANFVFVFKRRIIIGDAATRKVLTFDSYEEMGPELKKYFPTLEDPEIEKAIEAFNQHEIVSNPYDYIL